MIPTMQLTDLETVQTEWVFIVLYLAANGY